MKRRRPKPANFDYDFTNLAVEVTGDALYLINGGAEIENSYEAQARANPGDTVTDSNGVQHTLWQGDIDYAQKLTGITGQSAGTVTSTGTVNNQNYSTSANQKEETIFGWRDNGDGTKTVISKGATLWDAWGSEWNILSGVTDEKTAANIHVGETYGIKYSTSKSPNYSSFLVEELRKEAFENPIIPYKENKKSNSLSFTGFRDNISFFSNSLTCLDLIDNLEYNGSNKYLSKLSKSFGYITLGTDVFAYINDASIENMQSVIVDLVGFKDPLLSIGLSSYYSFANSMLDLYNYGGAIDLTSNPLKRKW